MEHNFNNTRLEVYSSSNYQVQYLYDHIGISLIVNKLSLKYNIESNLLIKMEFTIGDIILGFYKIEDTVPLLQQELGLDAKTAALLGADVLDFLAPLSDPNWQPPAEVENDDSSTEEITTVPAEQQDSVPISFSEVTTASDTESEPIVTTIPELRTMAGDMQEERSPVRSTFNAAAAIDEPVYTSTQPTIVRKTEEVPSYTAPMYEQPKPNLDVPIEKPRWG